MTQILANKRVLVLEDEPLISMSLVDALEEAGCVVVGPAYSASQAFDLIANQGIDAAVLDVNLGSGATSAPVADALVKLGVPFVFATGHGEDGLRSIDRQRPRVDKPYYGPTVVAAIVEALDSADQDKQG